MTSFLAMLMPAVPVTFYPVLNLDVVLRAAILGSEVTKVFVAPMFDGRGA